MTPTERVLSKLPDAKRNGAGWEAKCPAHDDKRASLSIGTGDDGRALLKCHAGCPAEKIVESIGMKMRDLFPPQASGRAKRRIVAAYDYQDDDGKLLYQVVRYEPKDFRQRRPDGKGKWIWNMKGVQRVLYRLPQLLKAAPTAWVFLCEGEKDVEALAKTGLTATTNPGGAGKWQHVDDTPLIGLRVAIPPDNDDAGEAHALDVATQLHGRAAEIRIIHLPGLPPKGDLSDWLAAGGTAEALLALMNAAPTWTTSKSTQTNVLAQTTPPIDDNEPIVVNAATVTPRPVNWLWPGRFPLGKLSLLIGDPEVGKSFLTLDIAARVSRGTPWPDTRGAVNTVGNIIIVSAEDDIEDTIVPRLAAAGADLKRIEFLKGVQSTDPHTGKINKWSFCLADLDPLEKLIARTPDVRLVIVDPVTAFLGSKTDSHKNADVRAILAPLAELAGRYRVVVLAVTHLNKNAAGSAMYRAMGSLGFVAAARAVWCAIKAKDNPARRLLLRVKNNLARDVPGMAYSIVDTPNGPAVAWDADPVSGVTADQALAPEPSREDRTRRDDAAEWLRETLAEGPVSVKDIQRIARDCGHSWRTIERAKTETGIGHYKEGFGKDSKMFWTLPSHTSPTSRPTHVGGVCERGGVWTENPKNAVFRDGSNPQPPIHRHSANHRDVAEYAPGGGSDDEEPPLSVYDSIDTGGRDGSDEAERAAIQEVEAGAAAVDQKSI